MEVAFAPSFIRALKALPLELQEEALEKIDAFQDIQNHKQLRVHALTGRLDGRFSFSVNFKTRIIFMYSSKKPKIAFLLMIGNHEIYQ